MRQKTLIIIVILTFKIIMLGFPIFLCIPRGPLGNAPLYCISSNNAQGSEWAVVKKTIKKEYIL